MLSSPRGIEGYVALRKKGKGLPDPNESYPATARMRERLRTERGQRLCDLRKQVVEPVFGWIKRCLGFESFSMRSRSKAAGEWSLVCLALNLKRMRTLHGPNAGRREGWTPGWKTRASEGAFALHVSPSLAAGTLKGRPAKSATPVARSGPNGLSVGVGPRAGGGRSR